MAKTTKRQTDLLKLISNPLFIKVVTYLAPIILSFISKKLSEKSAKPSTTTENGRKSLKNKAD